MQFKKCHKYINERSSYVQILISRLCTQLHLFHCHATFVSHDGISNTIWQKHFQPDSNYHRSSDNLNQYTVLHYAPISLNMGFSNKKLL